MEKTITADGVRIAHENGLVTVVPAEKLEKLLEGAKRNAEHTAELVRMFEEDLAAVRAAKLALAPATAPG